MMPSSSGLSILRGQSMSFWIISLYDQEYSGSDLKKVWLVDTPEPGEDEDLASLESEVFEKNSQAGGPEGIFIFVLSHEQFPDYC
jgi:hypothetical protein